MPNLSDHISDAEREALQAVADEQHRQQERMATARRTERSVTDTIEQQRRRGFRPNDQRTHIQVADARRVLWRELVAEVGEAVWLPEYEKVAAWLADNKGKGLLCMGDCGRGKTVITQRILPRIFQQEGIALNCFTAIDLLNRYEEISQYKNICIDDMGTEPNAKKYGVTHNYVAELVDLAERRDKLIVLSTNLNKDEILDRYDLRTFDRLKSIAERIVFKGESYRDDDNLFRALDEQQQRWQAAKNKK